MGFFNDEIDDLMDEFQNHPKGSESERIILTKLAGKVYSFKDFERVWDYFPHYPAPTAITLLLRAIEVINNCKDLKKLRDTYVRSGSEIENAVNNKIAQICF